MEGIIKVDPIIIYPFCLLLGGEQDCFNCKTFKIESCNSPRCVCLREYPNHKMGCSNYGKKKGCPPDAPMFDEVYDLLKPIYAIYNVFDFKGHVSRMREKHPDWSKRQLECCLYWQGTARKQLKEQIEIFKKLIPVGAGWYIITTVPEAMGVSVTETMKRVGVELEWPPVNVAHHVALAGIARKESK